jgi:uncharacterized protein
MEEQEAWARHATFMEALVADGFVVVGGPLGDRERTLLVVRADDADAIAARLSDDPWVSLGLLELVSVEPWQVRLGQERLQPGRVRTKADVRSYHLVTEERGAAWDSAREREEQEGWGAHANFMDALDEDGFVVFGGPIGDGRLVWLVIAGESEGAIRARLNGDPWLRDEILRVAGVEPWEIRLGVS